MANLIVSPKTFITYSLGCRTNQAEMEKIGSQLIGYGLQQVKNGQADLILLNTCSVTQKADKETRQKINELRKKYPQSFLVVLGCGVTAKEKYSIALPKADLFISNQEKVKAIEIILKSFEQTTKAADCLLPNRYTNPYIQSGRKFIKIQDGCDLFCSFCLTAYLRGKPTSVPFSEIIKEINYWADLGIKEAILTGINIALYGKDLKNKTSIVNLLENIISETKIERITLSSIYPEMLNKEFIKFIIENPRITRSFHLSLQSGSASVLKRMNRNLNINELTDSLLFIKNKIPNFTFRADIISGFPGENENEFKETLEFIKSTKISFAHVFTYSPRKGTAAFEIIKSKKWTDVPEAVKKKRAAEIAEAVSFNRANEGKNLIGNKTNCLIVRQLGNQWEGITENGWQIKIKIKIQNPKIKIIKGKIMLIRITDFKEDQLFGEILSF